MLLMSKIIFYLFDYVRKHKFIISSGGNMSQVQCDYGHAAIKDSITTSAARSSLNKSHKTVFAYLPGGFSGSAFKCTDEVGRRTKAAALRNIVNRKVGGLQH